MKNVKQAEGTKTEIRKQGEIECPNCFPEPLPMKTGVNAGKAAVVIGGPTGI